ncbi:unnamed protein product [Malus baccata var. baccata]
MNSEAYKEFESYLLDVDPHLNERVRDFVRTLVRTLQKNRKGGERESAQGKGWRDDGGDKLESDIPSASNDNASISTEQPHDSHQTSNIIEPQEKVFDVASLELERDPGKRIQLHEQPINQQDEVRRPSSLHNTCVSRVKELINPSQHVDKVINRQSKEEILKNRLHLKATVEGHDESVGSKNHGNFIELVKHTTKFNDKMAAVVLENAQKNAKYSSPMIQKEDTTAPTLHREIKKVLAFHELPINKLRGQGYDGASNMRALGSIVNVITTSPKHHTQLQVAHTVNIKELEIMGIIDILCRELQNNSQDILNAMNLVTTTKDVLQKLRLDGEATFIDKVSLFCKKHDVDMPDMNAQYKVGSGSSCQQTDHITFKHQYHIDIFNNAIDFQLAELNSRFSEEAMELFILSLALEPSEAFKAFNIEHICKLAEKFYPMDFTEKEKELHALRCELKIYESDIPHHPVFQKMSTTSELCRGLVETKRFERYHLIDRLIRLVLTLPISTATTERAFLAMNLIKTRRRNKMESEFLADSMVVYIEKELAEKIDSEEITKDFNSIKD